METVQTFDLAGWTFTLRNTLRQEMRLKRVLRHFPLSDTGALDNDDRVMFALIQAFTTDITGEAVPWSLLPDDRLTQDELAASFEAFVDTWHPKVVQVWYERINALREAPFSPVEKHASLLTVEEAADPNSGRRARTGKTPS